MMHKLIYMELPMTRTSVNFVPLVFRIYPVWVIREFFPDDFKAWR